MTVPPSQTPSEPDLADQEYQASLPSDAELLDLYVLGGQTEALLTLVSRFTPMAIGCRTLSQHESCGFAAALHSWRPPAEVHLTRLTGFGSIPRSEEEWISVRRRCTNESALGDDLGHGVRDDASDDRCGIGERRLVWKHQGSRR